jgi:transposase-like protein
MAINIEKDLIKCPICKSKYIVKKGKRKTKLGNAQIYQCKDCGNRFSDRNLKNIMYSPQIIYYALNMYNLGHNLRKTSIQVNKKFKIKTSKSTIHNWTQKYKDLCPIDSMKDKFKGCVAVLFSKHFEHENLDYLFMYHRYKLEAFTKEGFQGLNDYIKSFEAGCPDVFFEVGQRCSKPLFQINIETKKQVNLACRMAKFAVGASRNNIDRHKLVEKFMLINDKATIACEVPVWYWDKKINDGVTGHIDMIQVRNGLVYMLDYKPNAEKQKKAASQLYHYATAFSYRTRIPFERIRCAWFDEDSYFEYAPISAKVGFSGCKKS